MRTVTGSDSGAKVKGEVNSHIGQPLQYRTAVALTARRHCKGEALRAALQSTPLPREEGQSSDQTKAIHRPRKCKGAHSHADGEGGHGGQRSHITDTCITTTQIVRGGGGPTEVPL